MMIEYINYEEKENSVLVGFKKENFVVYGEIGVVEGFIKEQYLQKLYEQCKSAIDYETERYNQGLSNSIVTDLEGEEFIPELPKLQTLRLLVGKDNIQFEEKQENEVIYLSTITKDQYGDDIDVDVNITSTLGEIEDNILTISTTEEFTEVIITVNVGDIKDNKTIRLYPYVEPITPEPDKVDILETRVSDVEQTIDIMLGGEIIE